MANVLQFVILGDDRGGPAFASFARQVEKANQAVDRNNAALKQQSASARDADKTFAGLGDKVDKYSSAVSKWTQIAGLAVAASAGVSGAVGAVAVSFGGATVALGAFGALAKTTLSSAGKDATKLAELQQKLAAAMTAKQKAAIQQQITAMEQGWSKSYTQLVTITGKIQTQWETTSKKIASPVLVPWLQAVSKAMQYLEPLVAPVAAVFKGWGEDLNRYFSSAKGSAEIGRIAAALGRFGALQLSDIGIFLIDIGKAVANLARDLGANNVNFGTFGEHLYQWGAAFLQWSQSKAARNDVHALLEYVHNNGATLSALLKNLGKFLADFVPGLAAAGQAELRAITDFLGFINSLPAGIAKPLIDVAAALLLLQKTGVLSVGIKIIGPAAKWLSGGLINIGDGAAAAGQMRAAFTSGGAAAAAEIRAALATGGVPAVGGAGKAGKAGTAAEAGASAASSGVMSKLGSTLGKVLGGAIVAAVGNELANQLPPGMGRSLAKVGSDVAAGAYIGSSFGPVGIAIGAAIGAGVGIAMDKQLRDKITDFLGFTQTQTQHATTNIAGNFQLAGQAATTAAGELQKYTDVLALNAQGIVTQAPNRDKLVQDLLNAGVSATTANTDVDNYTQAIAKNGINSAAAQAARQQLNNDMQAAQAKAFAASGDINALTAAVQRHGSTSDAYRAARQKLADDFQKAGSTASQAQTNVNNLSTALANLPKNTSLKVSMSGDGNFQITGNDGKVYSITPGGALSPHARGGMITGGKPGKDSVLGMLMPGEVIVPTAMVKAGAVDHLRGQLPGFAAGGQVSGWGLTPSYVNSTYTRFTGAMADAMVASMRAAIKAAQAAAAKAASAGGPAGGDPSVNAALARQMFPAWASGALWQAWNYVAMRESGWNRFAKNPSSGAYGIPQALPESKLPAAGQSSGGSHAGPQISWMHDYMSGRYGGPQGAASHEQNYNWYARGTRHAFPGWAWVGERGPELIRLRGGEMVFPHQASLGMRSSIGSGGAYGLTRGDLGLPSTTSTTAAASAGGDDSAAALIAEFRALRGQMSDLIKTTAAVPARTGEHVAAGVNSAAAGAAFRGRYPVRGR